MTTLSATAHTIVPDNVDSSYYPPLGTVITDINEIVFYFRYDNAGFDTTYMSNSQSLKLLDKMLYSEDLLPNIDTLVVSAAASPEGRYDDNLELAKSRVLAFKKVLVQRYPFSATTVIETDYSVASLSKLVDVIEKDPNVPMKKTVLKILNSNIQKRVIGWKLKVIGAGRPWRYIKANCLPYLRNSVVSIDLRVNKPILTNVGVVSDIDLAHDTIAIPYNNIVKKEVILNIVPKYNVERKDLFAIKTNLLFDVISLVNVELEVPIGKRWSIAGEWIFPWWTWDKDPADNKRNRIQLLNGTIEGRYWFGKREERPQMTGWFAGLYVGGGLYDFEYKAKGYQGESYIMSGLSGGYAHTINKSGCLRMEYSLGVGYFETDYTYYESCFKLGHLWHAIRREKGSYSYIGPTRAKVSLVWMLNRKVKSGGVL